MTTEGCEGLDPPDISWHRPPGWEAWDEAVAEHKTELISQDFRQIRSDQISNCSAPKCLFCREGDGNNTYL